MPQSSQGVWINTERPPGRPLPPVVWEPPWPLSAAPELWIATAGPADTWGGAQVFWSEAVDGSDDAYEHVGMLSCGIVMGALLDPIPAGAPWEAFAEATCRVRLVGSRELPATSRADACAHRADCLIGDEVVGITMTRLLDEDDAGAVYECSDLLVRGGYGTGRTPAGGFVAHAAGEPFVRLDRAVCRVPLEARHVGRRIWLKLSSQNENAENPQELQDDDVRPIAVDVQGRWFHRDPRRWLG